MFTGIIEEMGVVQALNRLNHSARMTILASVVLEDLRVGDSITVNGVCLTVTSKTNKEFMVDVSPETMSVTRLGSLKAGDAVNLERALQMGSRLGGHWVSGHIDGVGTIRSRRKEENAVLLSIEAPREVLRYCIPKGSIAVDGVSLTINRLTEKEFEVAIIPHTAERTTLGIKGVGEGVNLECDLIGKYVERLLLSEEPPAKITRDYLKRKGLL
jgi:riboflavin synthase